MNGPVFQLPVLHLSAASAALTRDVLTVNEHGHEETVSIPAERALTVYVDKRELVTLMTLGAQPELLVLGYLCNQRLIASAGEVASITVDWDVSAAAVKTHQGIADIEGKTARRVVTTGCGQGSVFGDLMADIDQLQLPQAQMTQQQLYNIINAIRLQESTYKSAGSVHGCALFAGDRLQCFVEDVGRHNAIDTIAGWLAMNVAPTLGTGVSSLPPEGAAPCLGRPGAAVAPTLGTTVSTLPPTLSTDMVFYTTGRLTSEMVIKAAQMGVPIVVSRSGITQMGYEIAEKLGLCAIGRATNKHFVCYTGRHRLVLQTELAKR